MSSLKKKAIRGVGWSFADNIANSGITFLVGLVLARLLSPAEFGILGMITVFIAVSNSIVDSGFSNALIRKTDARDVDYATVFYCNLLLGVVLYAVLFVCAPVISRFFNQPVLIPVTRVMAVILVINACALIQRTLLIKKVDFKSQMKISLIASITSGVVGIGMALRGGGVWSLVGQQVSRQLVNAVLLWLFSAWRPALAFSRQSFRELFGFGSKLVVSGLIDTLYRNIYYLIIGRFYTAAQLGHYTRAEQFNIIFSSNLTSVVQRVSYPVLSSIQHEPQRLKQAYRRVIKTTMMVAFACMLGLAAVARPLIVLLIGEKWLPAVYFLQILCFSGMLYPLHAINLNILQVKGRSDLYLRLEIIKKCMAVFPISMGIFLGIEYMLWASVLNSFAAYFLNSYYSGQLIGYPSREQIRDLLPSFCVSLGVAAAMWGLTFLGVSYWLMLPLQCLAGLAMFVLVYESMKLPEYVEMKELVWR